VRNVSVSSVGEFGLIERISNIVGPTSAVIGIGDDAAVIDRPGDFYLLAAVDMLVEGVHFRLATVEADELGRRAIEVNVSDIASMGGIPEYALVSLAMAPALRVSFVDDLYQGMVAAGRSHGAQIVGGNIASTEGPLIVDVTLFGSVAKGDLVTRVGAQIGDVLAVTGTLGDGAAARLLTDRGGSPPDPDLQSWIRRTRVPRARIVEGQALARAHLAHAMIDISDGLSGDVRHLCRASGVGAVLDERSLPISRGTAWASRELKLDPTEVALSGGEDYQLLVAMAEQDLSAAESLGVSLTVIGRVVPAARDIRALSENGSMRKLTGTGWEHF
jgi:thiamine-monophosphate kinase